MRLSGWDFFHFVKDVLDEQLFLLLFVKMTVTGCEEPFVTVRLLFGENFVLISYITEIFSSVIFSVPAIIFPSFLGVSFILEIFNEYTVEIDTSSYTLKFIKKE